ncbi:hypothetical protein EDD68_10667 [Melghiribacillus thermohalophilus]|uniref:Uncharacterized protein n=1 Tax=Melghiribacillus thermohalophilus TaxID=1324956 RepID=A0A4R3N5E8_9BACI|nr:hypothetical protein [Melghiribacillus thermohalophilus]TCT23657.1 hypothetical protein EDD68_10667 [Melghiribacillus thermohalophilus]
MAVLFVPFALFILFIFNAMTYRFCTKAEMSNERQIKVFRTINVSITILLISSYLEVLYT